MTPSSVLYCATPVAVDTDRASSTRRRPSRRVSPAAVYQSVSGHIVALVTCRPRPRLCGPRPSSATQEKRTRGDSDESLTSVGTSSSGDNDNDNDHDNDNDNDNDGFRRLRAAQAVCLHCRTVYFVARAVGGRHAPFCSLDCRTSAEFVDRLQREAFCGSRSVESSIDRSLRTLTASGSHAADDESDESDEMEDDTCCRQTNRRPWATRREGLAAVWLDGDV